MRLLELNEIKKLNSGINPYVYFLFKEDKLVYIGKSSFCVNTRISHHKSQKKDFNSFKVLPVKQGDINFIERMYIEKYKPIYNIHGVREKFTYIKKKNRNIILN